jgi:tRNA(Ile2) C34 agmatinyltransferase TiaS
VSETIRDRIRDAISDSYYDARNDGLTMEHAADTATAKVMAIITEDVVVALEQKPRESPVCPYCGMTTWVDGRCALPGCEGNSVLIVVEKTDG